MYSYYIVSPCCTSIRLVICDQGCQKQRKPQTCLKLHKDTQFTSDAAVFFFFRCPPWWLWVATNVNGRYKENETWWEDIQPQVAEIKTSLQRSIIVYHRQSSAMLASDAWNIPAPLRSNRLTHTAHLETLDDKVCVGRIEKYTLLILIS